MCSVPPHWSATHPDRVLVNNKSKSCGHTGPTPLVIDDQAYCPSRLLRYFDDYLALYSGLRVLKPHFVAARGLVLSI